MPVADVGHRLLLRRLNEEQDPRIGSSRDNSSAATVVGVSTGSNSSSVSALFSTLIPVAIYAGVCLAAFILSRRRFPRVYAPRTFLSSLHPYERSPPLPSTWFTWVVAFWKTPDIYVLNHSSLDAYLFLRYLKVLCLICVVGICLTWPILFPLHVYGGGTGSQLDKLTFGNVTHPKWYFVHAFLAWLFFGFILYTVCRECLFYVNLRQAYNLHPFYANRLSSRTVLFTCIPQQYLDEAKLRKVFGDSVKRVWIPRTSWSLERLVREREQTASRLQDAEIILIRKASRARRLQVQGGHPDAAPPDVAPGPKTVAPIASAYPSTDVSALEHPDKKENRQAYGADGPPFDVPGSIAAQWIPQSARPTHRPLANYGRSVDTIRWTRRRLKELTRDINRLQRKMQRGNAGSTLPAAFIEFTSQIEAQQAYQALVHHRPSHMSQKYINVRPYEIHWWSLRMRWWERIIRQFCIISAICVLIIFWSIPSAFVGLLSNINFLVEKVPFLAFIKDIPSVILGLITGLLPALMLSLLMAIVPGIMRVFARLAGVPSRSLGELFVQRSYFGFQVVQVFLVTTFTSAASASIVEVIEDPLSARDLLSSCLPKASNFYLSYITIQCLGMTAGRLAHFSDLFFFQVMHKFMKDPKKRFERWNRLSEPKWGSIFPVIVNLGVITISYSVIAPLILGFSLVGFYIAYIIWKYNLLNVLGSALDTRGLVYPLALKQTLTGLYLAEICLLGLFALQAAFGPLVMMIGLIMVTAIVNYSLDDALDPLMYNLPRTLAAEEPSTVLEKDTVGDEERGDSVPASVDAIQPVQSDSYRRASVGSKGSMNGDPDKKTYQLETDCESDSEEGVPPTARGLPEGTETAVATVGGLLKLLFQTHLTGKDPLDPGGLFEPTSQNSRSRSHLKETIDCLDTGFRPLMHLVAPPPPPPNPKGLKHAFLKYLHPEVYESYRVLRDQVPDDAPDPAGLYPASAATPEGRAPSHTGGGVDVHALLDAAYLPPYMTAAAPRVWIPTGDEAGVGAQEVAHTRQYTGVVAEGASWVGDRVHVDVDRRWEDLVDDGGGGKENARKTGRLRDPGLDWSVVRFW